MKYVDAGYIIALSALFLYAVSLIVRRRRLVRAATLAAADAPVRAATLAAADAPVPATRTEPTEAP